ncbi:gonadotropin-releasing hormone receptor-like [Acanthaster planci]|uniref:Gonadotropin-releasing hormone receptor-like n=1 Tax=Acanthaster planci TaxID=133434 RepID=A0A8B7Z8T1_ACAPL|nr:gonadotropin-releasing hormone receptor-like [Acanthaster planci]XP_022099676.1 gonadotropin-releasing hormone receptor-like [Acanthaster planci]XP_022099677.1 gonadotropin-releasing hormone receptor-like [Acanthaster planci]
MAAIEVERDQEFDLCAVLSSGFDCNENTTIPLPEFTPFTAFKVATLATMIIFSTVGNGIAIAVTCKIRGRRKSTVTTLILNLALVDLVVTYCHMLFHMVWYAVNVWLAGDALCKIAKFFSSFGLFASSFITVDVALDRCLAVLKPLGQRQRPFHIKLLILASYLLATLFSIPQLFVFRVEHWPYDPDVDWWQCVFSSDLRPPYAAVYTTLVVMGQVIFPLIIMFVAYGLIYNKVRQKIVMKETSENLSEMRQARSKLFLRAQRRTIRMAMAIFTVFTLNWLPYAFFCLWYLWFPHNTLPDAVFEISFLFGLTNSCFNPLIYGACNVRYCHKICACLGLRPTSKSVETSHSDGRSNNKTTMYSVRWQSSKSANNTTRAGNSRNNNKESRWGRTQAVPPEKQQMITTTT